MPERIIHTLDGKRGGFLFIMGIGWLAIGLSYTLGPTTQSRANGFAWLPQWLDANELGWLWVATALVAIVAALTSRNHPRRENIAFGAITIPPVLWAVIFGWAAIIGEHPTGWIAAISYSIFATIIWHCSSWPNPSRYHDVEGGSERT